jgi:diphosphomevalonate decarboxylase
MEMVKYEVRTAVATPNIALIKYWGRRDSALNLPFNSSLSMTLDFSLNTRTTVIFTDKVRRDTFYLNRRLTRSGFGNEKLENVMKVVNEMKEMAGVKGSLHALIASENSFPMDAGIASSSSGGAALVLAVNASLDLKLTPRELSIFARKISGSACRSVFGGIVRWNKGKRRDGLDSYSEKILDSKRWRDLMDIIAIVSYGKKMVSSSAGHDITSSTSPLYRLRPKLAEESIEKALNFIRKRDFGGLGELIMRDSNNMHAAMMDSWPPILYLNDISKKVIHAIEKLNETEGRIIAAYTFDAGPNPHIITLRPYVEAAEQALHEVKGIKGILKSGLGSGPKIVQGSLLSEDGNSSFKPLQSPF